LWDGGSTPFFLQFSTGFRNFIQDGTPVWLDSDLLPRYRKPQWDEPDPHRKGKMKEKWRTVWERRYLESGLITVLTSFFAVTNGYFDIRLVFNGTLLGFNAALRAPWFCLPNVNSHLLIVESGTFMADVDIGEIILNL
jgi:hypothetical protein